MKLPMVSRGPALPNWKTDAVHAEPFEKAGLIAMSRDRLEIRSDLDERGFILLDARDLSGSTRLSASGRALNIAISPYCYPVPLRSVSPLHHSY